MSPEAGESSELSKSCQQCFAQLNTNTLFTSVFLHRQNTMTYAIHTGTHETRAKNYEFALKARGPRPMVVPRPSQPLMMTSPLPTSAGASPADVTTGSGTFTST